MLLTKEKNSFIFIENTLILKKRLINKKTIDINFIVNNKIFKKNIFFRFNNNLLGVANFFKYHIINVGVYSNSKGNLYSKKNIITGLQKILILHLFQRFFQFFSFFYKNFDNKNFYKFLLSNRFNSNNFHGKFLSKKQILRCYFKSFSKHIFEFNNIFLSFSFNELKMTTRKKLISFFKKTKLILKIWFNVSLFFKIFSLSNINLLTNDLFSYKNYFNFEYFFNKEKINISYQQSSKHKILNLKPYVLDNFLCKKDLKYSNFYFLNKRFLFFYLKKYSNIFSLSNEKNFYIFKNSNFFVNNTLFLSLNENLFNKLHLTTPALFVLDEKQNFNVLKNNQFFSNSSKVRVFNKFKGIVQKILNVNNVDFNNNKFFEFDNNDNFDFLNLGVNNVHGNFLKTNFFSFFFSKNNNNFINKKNSFFNYYFFNNILFINLNQFSFLNYFKFQNNLISSNILNVFEVEKKFDKNFFLINKLLKNIKTFDDYSLNEIKRQKELKIKELHLRKNTKLKNFVEYIETNYSKFFNKNIFQDLGSKFYLFNKQNKFKENKFIDKNNRKKIEFFTYKTWKKFYFSLEYLNALEINKQKKKTEEINALLKKSIVDSKYQNLVNFIKYRKNLDLNFNLSDKQNIVYPQIVDFNLSNDFEMYFKQLTQINTIIDILPIAKIHKFNPNFYLNERTNKDWFSNQSLFIFHVEVKKRLEEFSKLPEKNFIKFNFFKDIVMNEKIMSSYYGQKLRSKSKKIFRKFNVQKLNFSSLISTSIFNFWSFKKLWKENQIVTHLPSLRIKKIKSMIKGYSFKKKKLFKNFFRIRNKSKFARNNILFKKFRRFFTNRKILLFTNKYRLLRMSKRKFLLLNNLLFFTNHLYKENNLFFKKKILLRNSNFIIKNFFSIFALKENNKFFFKSQSFRSIKFINFVNNTNFLKLVFFKNLSSLSITFSLKNKNKFKNKIFKNFIFKKKENDFNIKTFVYKKYFINLKVLNAKKIFNIEFFKKFKYNNFFFKKMNNLFNFFFIFKYVLFKNYSNYLGKKINFNNDKIVLLKNNLILSKNILLNNYFQNLRILFNYNNTNSFNQNLNLFFFNNNFFHNLVVKISFVFQRILEGFSNIFLLKHDYFYLYILRLFKSFFFYNNKTFSIKFLYNFNNFFFKYFIQNNINFFDFNIFYNNKIIFFDFLKGNNLKNLLLKKENDIFNVVNFQKKFMLLKLLYTNLNNINSMKKFILSKNIITSFKFSNRILKVLLEKNNDKFFTGKFFFKKTLINQNLSLFFNFINLLLLYNRFIKNLISINFNLLNKKVNFFNKLHTSLIQNNKILLFWTNFVDFQKSTKFNNNYIEKGDFILNLFNIRSFSVLSFSKNLNKYNIREKNRFQKFFFYNQLFTNFNINKGLFFFNNQNNSSLILKNFFFNKIYSKERLFFNKHYQIKIYKEFYFKLKMGLLRNLQTFNFLSFFKIFYLKFNNFIKKFSSIILSKFNYLYFKNPVENLFQVKFFEKFSLYKSILLKNFIFSKNTYAVRIIIKKRNIFVNIYQYFSGRNVHGSSIGVTKFEGRLKKSLHAVSAFSSRVMNQFYKRYNKLIKKIFNLKSKKKSFFISFFSYKRKRKFAKAIALPKFSFLSTKFFYSIFLIFLKKINKIKNFSIFYLNFLNNRYSFFNFFSHFKLLIIFSNFFLVRKYYKFLFYKNFNFYNYKFYSNKFIYLNASYRFKKYFLKLKYIKSFHNHKSIFKDLNLNFLRLNNKFKSLKVKIFKKKQNFFYFLSVVYSKLYRKILKTNFNDFFFKRFDTKLSIFKFSFEKNNYTNFFKNQNYFTVVNLLNLIFYSTLNFIKFFSLFIKKIRTTLISLKKIYFLKFSTNIFLKKNITYIYNFKIYLINFFSTSLNFAYFLKNNFSKSYFFYLIDLKKITFRNTPKIFYNLIKKNIFLKYIKYNMLLIKNFKFNNLLFTVISNIFDVYFLKLSNISSLNYLKFLKNNFLIIFGNKFFFSNPYKNSYRVGYCVNLNFKFKENTKILKKQIDNYTIMKNRNIGYFQELLIKELIIVKNKFATRVRNFAYSLNNFNLINKESFKRLVFYKINTLKIRFLFIKSFFSFSSELKIAQFIYSKKNYNPNRNYYYRRKIKCYIYKRKKKILFFIKVYRNFYKFFLCLQCWRKVSRKIAFVNKIFKKYVQRRFKSKMELYSLKNSVSNRLKKNKIKGKKIKKNKIFLLNIKLHDLLNIFYSNIIFKKLNFINKVDFLILEKFDLSFLQTKLRNNIFFNFINFKFLLSFLKKNLMNLSQNYFKTKTISHSNLFNKNKLVSFNFREKFFLYRFYLKKFHLFKFFKSLHKNRFFLQNVKIFKNRNIKLLGYKKTKRRFIISRGLYRKKYFKFKNRFNKKYSKLQKFRIIKYFRNNFLLLQSSLKNYNFQKIRFLQSHLKLKLRTKFMKKRYLKRFFSLKKFKKLFFFFHNFKNRFKRRNLRYRLRRKIINFFKYRLKKKVDKPLVNVKFVVFNLFNKFLFKYLIFKVKNTINLRIKKITVFRKLKALRKLVFTLTKFKKKSNNYFKISKKDLNLKKLFLKNNFFYFYKKDRQLFDVIKNKPNNIFLNDLGFKNIKNNSFKFFYFFNYINLVKFNRYLHLLNFMVKIFPLFFFKLNNLRNLIFFGTKPFYFFSLNLIFIILFKFYLKLKTLRFFILKKFLIKKKFYYYLYNKFSLFFKSYFLFFFNKIKKFRKFNIKFFKSKYLNFLNKKKIIFSSFRKYHNKFFFSQSSKVRLSLYQKMFYNKSKNFLFKKTMIIWPRVKSIIKKKKRKKFIYKKYFNRQVNLIFLSNKLPKRKGKASRNDLLSRFFYKMYMPRKGRFSRRLFFKIKKFTFTSIRRKKPRRL
jgi:hypothetical protein